MVQKIFKANYKGVLTDFTLTCGRLTEGHIGDLDTSAIYLYACLDAEVKKIHLERRCECTNGSPSGSLGREDGKLRKGENSPAKLIDH